MGVFFGMNRGEQALVNQRKEDAEKYEPKVVVRFSVFPQFPGFKLLDRFGCCYISMTSTTVSVTPLVKN